MTRATTGKTHTTIMTMETKDENIWGRITLEEFTQIRAILRDEGRDEEDKMVALAAVVQGCDEDTILNMPLTEVAPVFELVHKLNRKPERNKVRKHYHVGRWNLQTSDRGMNVAQWIDFQNYAREDFEAHLPDIMSVVLIPVGKRYNEGYDIAQLKEDLKKMTVADALAVSFFFRRKYLKSIRRMLTYLVGWTATKKGMREERRRSLELRREVSDMLSSL